MRALLLKLRDLFTCPRQRTIAENDAKLLRAAQTCEISRPRVKPRCVKPQTAAALLVVAVALTACSTPPDRRPARINHRLCCHYCSLERK